jgi:hypothetical protein
MGFVRMLSNSTKFYRVVIAVIFVNALFYLLFSLLVLAIVNRSIFIVLDAVIFAVLLYLIARKQSLSYFLGLVLIVFLLIGINFLSQLHPVLNVTFIEAAGFLSSLVSGIIALVGIMHLLSQSREKGLSYIRLSLLVSIFLTQFFQFYSQQLFAIVGLSLDILMLVTVETVLRSVRLQKLQQIETSG